MPLKLAGLLVTSGMVPSQLIDDALRRQVLAGDSIDTSLLELAASLPEEVCLSALAQASGFPSVGVRQLAEAAPEAVKLVPGKLAERHGLLPVRIVGRSLEVAVAYPVNLQMIEEVGFLLGRDLHPLVAIEARLREAISNAYGLSLPARHAALVAILGPVEFARRPAETAGPEGEQSAPAVEASQPPAPEAPAANEKTAPEAPAAEKPNLSAQEPPSAPPTEPAAATVVPEPAPAPVSEPPPPPQAELAAPADSFDLGSDDGPAPAAVQPRSREPDPFERQEPEGLATALEQVLAAAETNPKLLEPPAPPPPPRPAAEPPATPRRHAPRDRVDVAGIAGRIVAAAGGEAQPAPLDARNWTLGKAKAELEKAQDRHQIISVTLRFALKTFDFAAAFAVVCGNAVGWAAVTAEGKADEKVERISLPLDAPSVLRTVLLAHGSYLGPISKDALSQSLLSDMGRSPSTAFLYPVEVRDRPVVILYGDVVGRPASDRRVAELVLFAQSLGPRFERLILEQKRRLASQARTGAPELDESFTMQPPTLTAAELFARSPLRKRTPSDRALDLPLPKPSAIAPLPGVSRLAAARVSDLGNTLLPSMDELFGAADRLVSTDLNERVRALGELCRFPEVAAAVLVARFPGPLLRTRVPVTELPSPEELGPIPAALVHMGAAAGRALTPLLDNRDLDTRYFALLTGARLMSPSLLQPIAARVLDRHPVIASAARAALGGMRSLPGFEDALQTVREALNTRESDTVMAAARALGQLRDVGAIERLIELTGSPHKLIGQVASEALRETCLQTYGQSPGRWGVWWRSHREKPRVDWLVEALGHRDPTIRLTAIDELMHEVGDSFGFEAEGPKPEREKAIRRWQEWAKARPDCKQVG